MTPADARGMYRRQIAPHGSPVTLKRGSGGAGNEVTFKAKLAGVSPADVVGDLQQGTTKVIFMAEDLGDFPVPIKERSTDAIWIGTKKLTVQNVDDMTRRVAGELVAYELLVAG